ncbi:hypothetical protein EIM50_25765, partial [Pseudoxanthomonas sp. SGD-10]
GGLPYHEWFIEFAKQPIDLDTFRIKVDERLQQKNIYYSDLIKGKVLQPLKISPLKANAFIDMMRAEGKLGGQNKVPRLTNDRVLANKLAPFILS